MKLAHLMIGARALFHAALGARISWANGLVTAEGCAASINSSVDPPLPRPVFFSLATEEQRLPTWLIFVIIGALKPAAAPARLTRRCARAASKSAAKPITPSRNPPASTPSTCCRRCCGSASPRSRSRDASASPAYVTQVTRVWRAAIDAVKRDAASFAPTPAWQAELGKQGQSHTLGAYYRSWK